MKGQISSEPTQSDRREVNYEPDYYEDHSAFSDPIESRTYLPEDNSDVVHHTYYSLGYNEKTEQSNWVAYRLTKESLEAPNVPRAKRFKYDKDVSSRTAAHKDYSHSGYTRGHMAPAGDMAFNKVAMTETFLMSNMSPQVKVFNNGIWKELEENVRDWAFSNGELIVISGPIFYTENPKKIGKQTKVSVPDAFYKILLDNEGRDKKSIGFIIPHELATEPLQDFAVSIDEIEKQTGIDFFPRYFENDDTEEKMESKYNTKSWKISKKRYKQRVNSWNKDI